MFTKEQGKKLIDLARSSISSNFSGRKASVDDSIKKEFEEKRGVFVTLTINGELRGCIGFVDAIFPLWEAIVKAAESAAFNDSRFGQLDKEEFDKVKIEISVLTNPELIEVERAEEYINNIKIGEDGLIIESGYGKGLLLPQVAVEWKWGVRQFLEHTCEKAGLQKDSWRDLSNKIYKFQAQIFEEEES